MITVTDSAKAELKNILQENSSELDEGLRLIVNRPGNFALMLDRKQENDNVVEHEGLNIILYQKEMENVLDDIIIDCRFTENGRMLVISK